MPLSDLYRFFFPDILGIGAYQNEWQNITVKFFSFGIIFDVKNGSSLYVALLGLTYFKVEVQRQA